MAQHKIWMIIGAIGLGVVILGIVIGIPLKNRIVNQYKVKATEEAMQLGFQRNILTYAEKLHAFPDEKQANQEMRGGRLAVDAWGNQVQYSDLKKEQYVELRSAGADGEMHTADDVVVTSQEMPASFGAYHKTAESKEKGKRNKQK